MVGVGGLDVVKEDLSSRPACFSTSVVAVVEYSEDSLARYFCGGCGAEYLGNCGISMDDARGLDDLVKLDDR